MPPALALSSPERPGAEVRPWGRMVQPQAWPLLGSFCGSDSPPLPLIVPIPALPAASPEPPAREVK